MAPMKNIFAEKMTTKTILRRNIPSVVMVGRKSSMAVGKFFSIVWTGKTLVQAENMMAI